MRVSGRRLGVALLVLAGTLGVVRADDGRPSLYVYLNAEIKPARLEKSLREKLPALDVTVFGRFRDFEEALVARRPDAVLALQPVMASQGLKVMLQGRRGGQDWEPYVLVARTDDAVAGKVIGVVDLLGRDGTQDLVVRLVGTSDVKINRVAKTEDLLPLLQIAAADAVLVPRDAVKSLTERSRLALRVRDLPASRVGLAAVGVLTPRLEEAIVPLIRGLDADTNRSLRVDEWAKR